MLPLLQFEEISETRDEVKDEESRQCLCRTGTAIVETSVVELAAHERFYRKYECAKEVHLEMITSHEQ